ncbi:hypothetical protein E4L96_20125 [Massilia arenosa]|uniref:Uncharacterized protein n=1 Tax=Zemynaea arenosa TaxID=2561931 RepID=A0A4Y9S050_9BURK|nr:hypothetical protein [Massilia arenosa]TFW13406.1 hypothetical protein E4L96_20125 [Massilia arenosa]
MLATRDLYLGDRIVQTQHVPLKLFPGMLLELEAAGVPDSICQILQSTLAGRRGYESRGIAVVEVHADQEPGVPPEWRVYLPQLWLHIRTDFNPIRWMAGQAAAIVGSTLETGLLLSEGDGLYVVSLHASPEREFTARRWLAERLGDQVVRRKLNTLSQQARNATKERDVARKPPEEYVRQLVTTTFRLGPCELDSFIPVVARRLQEAALDLREVRLGASARRSANFGSSQREERMKLAAARRWLTETATQTGIVTAMSDFRTSDQPQKDLN